MKSLSAGGVELGAETDEEADKDDAAAAAAIAASSSCVLSGGESGCAWAADADAAATEEAAAAALLWWCIMGGSRGFAEAEDEAEEADAIVSLLCIDAENTGTTQSHIERRLSIHRLSIPFAARAHAAGGRIDCAAPLAS